MMILSALLLVAIPQLDAVDDANLALTTCGFAIHRSANERNLSDGQFAQELMSGCARQIGQMRQATIALDQSRGKTSAAATRDADALIANFVTSIENQYARRAEDARKLRELQRALEQEGGPNAQ